MYHCCDCDAVSNDPVNDGWLGLKTGDLLCPDCRAEAEEDAAIDPFDMDGDFDSAMTSAGFGLDEHHGFASEIL